MRCLYCGKELALLKRLTGGGDFCSDVHRRQYKEEYNELALNRLLQAKSQPKPEVESPNLENKAMRAAVAALAAPESEVAVPEASYVEPAREIQTATLEVKTVSEAYSTSEPNGALESGAHQPEEAAPAAPTGFLIDLPVPVMAEVASMAVPETDLEHDLKPSIPSRNAEVSETWLPAAGQVVLEPSTRFRDYAMRRSDRGQEIREFGRSAPSIEMDWPAVGGTALETSEEPMEILIFPRPPQGSPGLWQEPERTFETLETELGDLVRLMFSTTGIEDDKKEEAGREDGGTFSDITVSLNGLEAFTQPAAAPAAERVPDLVTKPLPLTLHGLAAGRGKPVQVFSPAAARAFDVQIPRSSALPLRPLMTLGPMPTPVPAGKAIEKPEPERTVVKIGTTVRKLDARTLEPETRQSEKRPELRTRSLGGALIPPAAEAKPDKVNPESGNHAPPPISQEVVREEPKPAPPIEPSRPAPPSAPQISLDLGLPSLDLKKPSESLWARIPMPAKIACAAAALILIGLSVTAAITHFSSRNPRVVEAGPALPISGWVKGWDTGPQVQITVLQGTLNLSDYRVQFEAQIDTKAVGWVFRARDAKNFYASKLEVVKTGSIWTAILARFAVIGGQEEPRARVPLSFAVRENTVYKIRLEAVGDHFATWIQDQKVDEFSDSRIKTGGVGLYSERGESAILKSDLSVTPLTIKR